MPPGPIHADLPPLSAQMSPEVSAEGQCSRNAKTLDVEQEHILVYNALDL